MSELPLEDLLIGGVSAKEFFGKISSVRSKIKISTSFFKNATPEMLFAPVEVLNLMVRWMETWFKAGGHEGLFRLRKDSPRNRELIMVADEQLHVWVICIQVKLSQNSSLDVGVSLEGFVKDIEQSGRSDKRLGQGIEALKIFLFGMDAKAQHTHDEFDAFEMQLILQYCLQLQTQREVRFLFQQDAKIRADYEKVKATEAGQQVLEDIRTCLIGNVSEYKSIVDRYTQVKSFAEPQSKRKIVVESKQKITPIPINPVQDTAAQVQREHEVLHAESHLSFEEKLAAFKRLQTAEAKRKQKQSRTTVHELQMITSYSLKGKEPLPLNYNRVSQNPKKTEQ
ncbi:hypothetical protein WDW89_13065 [Deltaproteobacteria bacterium TL4]